MSANAHKVVHRAESADRGPFLDDHMTTKRSCVGQDHVISDDAIVCDMSVSHDQNVAAHTSQPATLHGATIDGGKFADHIVIADFEESWFARIADVLRSHAD